MKPNNSHGVVANQNNTKKAPNPKNNRNPNLKINPTALNG